MATHINYSSCGQTTGARLCPSCAAD